MPKTKPLPDAKLVRLADELYNRPLALDRRNLALLLRMSVNLAELQQVFAYWWDDPFEPKMMEGGVAVLPIKGSLMRSFFFDDYADIKKTFDTLQVNPRVRAVVLDIDSPGGSVAGLFDLVDHMAQAEGKPMYALANGQATSAAYAIGATAQKFYATREAVVGSIGAIAMHVDYSKMDEKMGVKVTEVVAGKHKNDLSPNKPLNADGKSTLQMLVDAAYEQFVASVAANRSMSEKAVRATEAAVYLPPEAEKASLIDGVRTLEEVVKEAAEPRAAVPGLKLEPLTAELPLEGGGVASVTLNAHVETVDGGDGRPLTRLVVEHPELPDGQLVVQEGAEMPDPIKDQPQPEGGGTGAGAPSKVIDIDAHRKQVEGEVQAQQAEIRQICALARLSAEETLAHLTSGLRPDAVRAAILKDREEADRRASPTHGQHSEADDGFKPRVIDVGAIYAKRQAVIEAAQRKEG